MMMIAATTVLKPFFLSGGGRRGGALLVPRRLLSLSLLLLLLVGLSRSGDDTIVRISNNNNDDVVSINKHITATATATGVDINIDVHSDVDANSVSNNDSFKKTKYEGTKTKTTTTIVNGDISGIISTNSAQDNIDTGTGNKDDEDVSHIKRFVDRVHSQDFHDGTFPNNRVVPSKFETRNGRHVILGQGDALYRKDTWDTSPVVLEKYKLLFFTVPKIGCTAFKQLFRRMMGFPNWQDHQYYTEPFLPHNPDQNGLKYLSDYPFDVANDMLVSENWTRAIFTREPKERALSGYLDKAGYSQGSYVRMQCCGRLGAMSPGWEAIGCAEGKTTYTTPQEGETNAPILPFHTFLTQVIPACSDPHWEPQATRMAPKYWNQINFVGRFENVFEDTQRLLTQVGAWEEFGASGWTGASGQDGAMFDPNQKAKHGTSAQHKMSKEQFFTPTVLEAIVQYYAADFDHPVLKFQKPEIPAVAHIKRFVGGRVRSQVDNKKDDPCNNNVCSNTVDNDDDTATSDDDDNNSNSIISNKNIPVDSIPTYWINLDKRTDRAARMIDSYTKYAPWLKEHLDFGTSSDDTHHTHRVSAFTCQDVFEIFLEINNNNNNNNNNKFTIYLPPNVDATNVCDYRINEIQSLLKGRGTKTPLIPTQPWQGPIRIVEIACTLSHIYAIYMAYLDATTKQTHSEVHHKHDAGVALIVEDDVMLDNVDRINRFRPIGIKKLLQQLLSIHHDDDDTTTSRNKDDDNKSNHDWLVQLYCNTGDTFLPLLKFFEIHTLIKTHHWCCGTQMYLLNTYAMERILSTYLGSNFITTTTLKKQKEQEQEQKQLLREQFIHYTSSFFDTGNEIDTYALEFIAEPAIYNMISNLYVTSRPFGYQLPGASDISNNVKEKEQQQQQQHSETWFDVFYNEIKKNELYTRITSWMIKDCTTTATATKKGGATITATTGDGKQNNEELFQQHSAFTEPELYEYRNNVYV